MTFNDGVPGLGPGDELAQQRRRQELQTAWDAYVGKTPDALTPQPGQPDVNVKSNRLAPIVDTGVYYLFGLPLAVEVQPTATDPTSGKPTKGPQDEAAQEYLDGCWGDDDERMTTLAKLAMNGAIFGQAFAKILPADPTGGHDFPRLVVLDPQTVSVQTDPDDCDTALSYTIEYDASLPDGSTIRKRQVIARRDVYEEMAALDRQLAALDAQARGAGQSAATGATPAQDADGGSDAADSFGDEVGWVITSSVRRGQGGDWRPVGASLPWPHAWSPILECQNLPVSNQHWGMADLTPDLIQLNRVLNFVLTNINAIGLSHGHPWIWAENADVSQITTGPGNIIALPDGGSLNALIANGDIAGLMAYAADIRSSMDEQSKVPGVATGRIAELPRGQMSGVSLRMLYQPLLFKTTFKRRGYGKLIREAGTRMLALGGFGDGTDRGGVKVATHWKDPMPTDDLQEAQTALAWQQLGVSQDTLMQRGGFDPDTETAKTEIETQRKMELQNQGMLALGAGGMMPPIASGSRAPAQSQSQPPADGEPGARSQPIPPVNHPAAIATRQAAQLAAGKPVTPDGKKPGAK